MKPAHVIWLAFGWCILRIISRHNNRRKSLRHEDLQTVFQKLVSTVDWLIRNECSGRPWIAVTDIHSNFKSSWALSRKSITYATIHIEFDEWPCQSIAVHINTSEGLPNTVNIPFHEHYIRDLSDEQLKELQRVLHSAILLYAFVEVTK